MGEYSIMKKLFKKLSIIFSVVLAMSTMTFFGCNNETTGDKITPSGDKFATSTVYTPYTMATSTTGKDYIVDQNDNVYVGLTAFLPTDLYCSADGEYAEQQEKYFKLASEAGFNSVDVPFMWSQVELDRGEYSNTEINHYLDYCKKYNLKLNIVWYGSLIDGQSMSYSIPDYITENTATYSLIKLVCDRGPYGTVSVRNWNDPDLLDREGKALTQLLNYVAEWNTANSGFNPVVMVQLGQGADRFAKWRIKQYDIQGADGIMTAEESKPIINAYLEGMAKAVKSSNYRALTRVDFCESTAVTSEITNIRNINNIDMASPTYLHTLASNKTAITDFNGNASLGKMAIVNAENFPSDVSSNESVNKYSGDRQLLTTFLSGGVGHTTYYLAPPMYYPVSPYGSIYKKYDEDTNSFEQYLTAGGDMKSILEIMSKAPYALATLNSTAITGLYMDGTVTVGGTQKIYLKPTSANKYVYVETTVPNDSKALGFVGCDGNYVYIASTINTTVKISGCTIVYCMAGYQDADGMVYTNGSNVNSNGTITIEAGKCYFAQISGGATGSSTSGYKTPLNSLNK